MLDQVFGTYFHQTCQTCQSHMSGASVAGWAMAVAGMIVLLGGIFMQLSARWLTDPAPSTAQSQSLPVMDTVQREDLERRAAQAPQAGSGTPQGQGASRALIMIGGGVAIFGLIFAATVGAGSDAADSQLRSAAAKLVSDSLNGSAACQDPTGGGSGLFPSYLLSNPYGSDPQCDPSPRSYAYQASDVPGVPITIQYVYSTSFTTDGEVTVHDTTDNHSVCVTVPDYDASDDPSAYITSGACHDAPVTDNLTP